MEDLLYRFLRLDPEVVNRYPKNERTLLQGYSIIVLLTCMTALLIWSSALYMFFNPFVALLGILAAYVVWIYDTGLLTTRGLRHLLSRLAIGLFISGVTTVCLSIIVYYQTAIYEAEQKAMTTELEIRTQMGEKLDAHRLKVEAKYKVELGRIDRFYNTQIDKLQQEQVRNANAYAQSGVKKTPKAALTPQGFRGIESEADKNAYQDPNRGYQYVDTVLQKQIEAYREERDKEKERIYQRIEQEIEKAREHTFYTPEVKPNVTMGNLGNIIKQTAFDEDTSSLSLWGILLMICMAIEFLPFVVRMIAFPFTKFITENTD